MDMKVKITAIQGRVRYFVNTFSVGRDGTINPGGCFAHSFDNPHLIDKCKSFDDTTDFSVEVLRED